jgi:hypothetical protein
MAWSVASVTDTTIEAFVEETGVDFPVFRDLAGTYNEYDQVGSSAPFPLDVVIDKNGIVRYVSTRYEPDVIEELILELREE